MMTSHPIAENDFIDQFIHYLSAEKNASPHTCRCYLRDLDEFRNFLKSSGIYLSPSGGIEIEKVDRMAIRRYLSFLHRKNKKSSIARKLSTLRSFFKYLIREQLAVSNPAKSVSTPKVEKPLPTMLTVDEVFRLIESPKSSVKKSPSVPAKNKRLRDVAILELLYSSGLRVGELVGLNLNHIGPGFGHREGDGKGKKGTHCTRWDESGRGIEGLFGRTGGFKRGRTPFRQPKGRKTYRSKCREVD